MFYCSTKPVGGPPDNRTPQVYKSTQPRYLTTRVTLYCCEVGYGVCHAEADHAVAVGAVADAEEGGGVVHLSPQTSTLTLNCLCFLLVNHCLYAFHTLIILFNVTIN